MEPDFKTISLEGGCNTFYSDTSADTFVYGSRQKLLYDLKESDKIIIEEGYSVEKVTVSGGYDSIISSDKKTLQPSGKVKTEKIFLAYKVQNVRLKPAKFCLFIIYKKSQKK